MVEYERQNADVTYRELFRKRMLNRTIIACSTQIWSQLTGMNVMMYYITYVFGMAGLTGNANLVSSSIQYVINVIMTLPGLWALDHIGRRPLLIGGSTFMMIWLFAVAGIMATYGTPAPPGGIGHVVEESWQVSGPASKAVIACSYLFVASFAPTWGPVSWVYPPEIFPLRVRGKGVALATACNWIFNFALGYFVPPSFENIQWRTYLVFGCFCFAMTVQAFFMYPETMRKSLEEVEDMFLSRVPAWRTHKGSKLDEEVSRFRNQSEAGTLRDTMETMIFTTPIYRSKSRCDEIIVHVHFHPVVEVKRKVCICGGWENGNKSKKVMCLRLSTYLFQQDSNNYCCLLRTKIFHAYITV